MAGRRAGSGRPRQQEMRRRRRRERLDVELAAATRPEARIAAAADYVRTALCRNPDAEVAGRLVQQLTAAGDQLLAGREEGA